MIRASPFRYVREDFSLGRFFLDLDHLSAQFRHWLDRSTNTRRRRSAAARQRRGVLRWGEAIYLKAPPAVPFNFVLTLDRDVLREAMLSVGGNL
jgi:hypothetical protein